MSRGPPRKHDWCNVCGRKYAEHQRCTRCNRPRRCDLSMRWFRCRWSVPGCGPVCDSCKYSGEDHNHEVPRMPEKRHNARPA